ncbi:2-amino-4-hydroxy-6-hydroxymethyldihydropteridine diphosphokinase [Haematomicrobium sanguinis]|uniref:2-amino-4-hydroxy-6- hydroxymethyldihydropteridine diphosphokinase n=1 Tax=Haematomicrobium sanguinis TaxID=479106 RepID=UPI00047CBDB2|nr:2-amino-4-hydroxy-6-hydroxymethyldihydropteridine diphosphokinase [Haematomicrobium sanguinis]
MQDAQTAVLALGSNLGDSASELDGALEDLEAEGTVRILKRSPRIRSKAVGGPEQPDYLNQVIEVATVLSSGELLAHTQSVENRHHRTREVRWGPRTLDIDIITYAEERSDDPALTLPHPRAAERAFVLQPWAWMDPEATLDGEKVAELAARAEDADGLVRVDE